MVFSLWFFSTTDTERVHNTLKGLISKVSIMERALTSNVLKPTAPTKLVAPVAKPAPKSSNIKDLLSFATEEYVNRSNVDEPTQPTAPLFDPSKPLTFQLQDIAVDALPLAPSFGECQFASDLEKSFKAAGTAHAPPKMDSTTTEMPAVPMKSEEDEKISEELLRRLRLHENSEISNKPAKPEGLSRNQLKAALIHLIETDDDFLTKLHSAYAESLNKHLTQRP